MTEADVAGGFHSAEDAARLHDEIDLNRAAQRYRQFFPTVSASMLFSGNAPLGLVPNRVSARSRRSRSTSD